MRFTFGTNVLVYAFDRNAGERHLRALELVGRARGRDLVLTLQSLGELFRTLTRPKYALDPARAARIVEDWREAVPIVAADPSCLADAMSAVTDDRWSFWDAMLWATAKANGCRVLISEDGQDGRLYGGVAIVDPFARDRDPWLERVFG